MSVNAAMLKQMRAEGLDFDAAIRVIEAGEQRSDPTAAERQRRCRSNKKAPGHGVTVTPRDKGSNDKDILTSQAEGSEPNGSSPQQRAWACPPDVDPQHWRDFRKNRKTKHLTDSETAYRGQLKALATLADDEWPPGRLVQFAAEKGWGSINDPRTPKHGQSASNISSLRGHRPDPALDLVRAARAAEDREDHWRAGSSLPAVRSG